MDGKNLIGWWVCEPGTRPTFLSVEDSDIPAMANELADAVKCDDPDTAPLGNDKTSFSSICKLDDVNGDLTDLVTYVELYCKTWNGSTLTSVLVGTYTDETCQAPYEPTSPTSCDEVGQDAHLVVTKGRDATGTCFYRLIDAFTGSVIRTFDVNGDTFLPAAPVTTCH